MRAAVANRGWKYSHLISENEFNDLLWKYAHFYDMKFRHIWKLKAELEDIYGELAETACTAISSYRGKSKVETFLISCFRRRMENYRRYLHVRQVKWGPMLRITKC